MRVKNIFKKENIMPVAVLAIICLVVAALLGAVNMITGPIIQKAEEQKVYDSLREVIDGEFAPAEIPEGASSDITAMYKVTDGGDLVGYAVTLSAKGYASQILMTVGVNADGSVRKVVITSQAESHGKAGMATYPDKFTGVEADALADVELFSGATISSTAIKNAVINAVNAVTGGSIEVPDNGGEDEELPKTDEELLALSVQLVGSGSTFTDVTPEDTELVKRVYKEDSGKGYVAYMVVISPNYGTVETETLVHIGNDGKIVNVMKLVWKTSDAMYGYVPPTEDVVNEYYAKLPGNNSASFNEDFIGEGEVEHVTNATNTSGRLAKSIGEALSVADSLIAAEPEIEIPDYAARIIGIVILALAVACPVGFGVYTYIKRRKSS